MSGTLPNCSLHSICDSGDQAFSAGRMAIHPELKQEIRGNTSPSCPDSRAYIIIAAGTLFAAFAKLCGSDVSGDALFKRIATSEAGVERLEDGYPAADRARGFRVAGA